MLHRVNGVTALSVLCLFNILGQCQLQSTPSSLLSQIPTEYDGCEELQNFISMLKSMPAHQAFAVLTLPLASASSPPKIQNIRQQLLQSVAGGSLPITNILHDLGHVKNHNRYDLLITTLMAINEYSNINCDLKEYINTAIFYLLKQKYLYKVDASDIDTFGTCISQSNQRNWPNKPKGYNFGSTPLVGSPLQKALAPPGGTSSRDRHGNTFWVSTPQGPLESHNVINDHNSNNGIVHLDRLTTRHLPRSAIGPTLAPFATTGRPRGRLTLRPSTGLTVQPTVLVMHQSPNNPTYQPLDSNASDRPIQLFNPIQHTTASSSQGTATKKTFPATHSSTKYNQRPSSGGVNFGPSPFGPGQRYNPYLNPEERNTNMPFSNLYPHGFIPNGRYPVRNPHPLFPYMNHQAYPISPYGIGRNRLYPIYLGTVNKHGFGPNGFYPGLLGPDGNWYPLNPTRHDKFGPDGGLQNDGGPDMSCMCQKHPFEILLNKIIDLEKRMSLLSQTSIPSNSSLKPPLVGTGEIPNDATTPSGSRVTLTPVPKPIPVVVKKPPFNVDNLLKVLPQPKYPREIVMFNRFRDLLRSPRVLKLINSMDLSKYHDDSELLEAILLAISRDVTITNETEEIIGFFMFFKEASKSDFNYGNLINVIPQPLDSKEVLHYNTIKNYLTSKDIYNDINSEGLKTIPNMGFKFLNVLQQLNNNSKISPNLNETVNYYIPIVSGMLNNIRFDDLISLLPVPKLPEDLVKYNTIKRFLLSNKIYVAMKGINLSSATSRMEVLKFVLRQLILNSQSRELQLVALYYRNILTLQKNGYDYFDLLRPITEDSMQQLYIIGSYMYTTEFENIVSQLQNLGSLSDTDKFFTILTAVEANASDKQQIVTSAKYILLKLNQIRFFRSMDKIPLLSKPRNEDEKQKLSVIEKFLYTEDAYQLLHNLDTTIFPDNKFLAEYILRTIIDANVSVEIKEAAQHLLSLSEKLETLEFVTKKEIKKNFQLHEIFGDTLDLLKMTLPQKNALRKFFKYLSDVRPQVTSSFDSWDEAKTRWQFVKLLFKYFLEKTSTPAEIQDSIKILDPLVKQEGRAALPP